jgi:hypothetical protein
MVKGKEPTIIKLKIKKPTCCFSIPKIFISKSFAISHMGYYPQNINHVQSLAPY